MEKGKTPRNEGVTAEREGGEEEEKKMEEFFALIRCFQEARNRRVKELENVMKAKSRRLNGEKSRWVPSFEWQDFREEVSFRKSPVIYAGRPCSTKDQKQEEEEEEEGVGDDGVDLKLTL